MLRADSLLDSVPAENDPDPRKRSIAPMVIPSITGTGTVISPPTASSVPRGVNLAAPLSIPPAASPPPLRSPLRPPTQAITEGPRPGQPGSPLPSPIPAAPQPTTVGRLPGAGLTVPPPTPPPAPNAGATVFTGPLLNGAGGSAGTGGGTTLVADLVERAPAPVAPARRASQRAGVGDIQAQTTGFEQLVSSGQLEEPGTGIGGTGLVAVNPATGTVEPTPTAQAFAPPQEPIAPPPVVPPPIVDPGRPELPPIGIGEPAPSDDLAQAIAELLAGISDTAPPVPEGPTPVPGGAPTTVAAGLPGVATAPVTGEEQPFLTLPQRSEGLQGLLDALQAESQRALAQPTVFDDALFQAARATGERQLDEDFARRREALEADLAARGLDFSSIAAGRLSDFGTERFRASEDLNTRLLLERANALAAGRAGAANQAAQTLGFTSGLEAQERGEVRGERSFIEQLAQQARDQELQAILAETQLDQSNTNQFLAILQAAANAGDPTGLIQALLGTAAGSGAASGLAAGQANDLNAQLQALARILAGQPNALPALPASPTLSPAELARIQAQTDALARQFGP